MRRIYESQELTQSLLATQESFLGDEAKKPANVGRIAFECDNSEWRPFLGKPLVTTATVSVSISSGQASKSFESSEDGESCGRGIAFAGS